MKRIKYLVLGAGTSGLSIAAELKSKGETDFLIVDKSESLPVNMQNGLHYLHSIPEVPFPFEFKSIPITEEIWDTRTDTFKKQANLPEIFEYSKKIMENIRHPASIQDPGKRIEAFVPESNDMNDLLKAYYKHIEADKFQWNVKLMHIDMKSKIAKFGGQTLFDTDMEISYDYIISTIPIPIFYEICGAKSPYEFKNKPLYITNYKTTNIVSNWLIGLYMSDPKFPPYRITTLNNILSMESLSKLSYEDEIIIKYIIGDLFDYELSSKTEYLWETGRIFGLTKQERKTMVQFFAENSIYLLGRYSTWNGKELMDSTIKQAKSIVEHLLNNKGRQELIEKLN